MIDILYEDNHIIVAVKPQNVPTQADSSRDPDFLSMVKDYVRVKYNKPGEAYIGLIHRLDRPTGGLMVFARTSKAAARLSAQLKVGTFTKLYSAAVSASVPESGTLTDWLLKDVNTNTVSVVPRGTPGAKQAILEYDTEAVCGNYTLLNIKLLTGRSHQIRAQLANIGAPICGDRKYGGGPAEYLCLWSHTVGFTHPTKKELMTFSAPLPKYRPFSLFRAH